MSVGIFEMSFNRIIILKGQCHDIKNSFNQVGGIDLQKGGRKYRKKISAIECYKDTRKKRMDQKC